MSDLENLWKQMEETNAGIMTIVLDAKGKNRSRAMILVDGQDEVDDIVQAVKSVQEQWDKL